MKLNKKAFEHAQSLIRNGEVAKDSDWSEAQPSPDDENQFLEKHSWDEYATWFLAIDTDENEETKGHYNYPFGDFDVAHRSALIAAKQRASEYDHLAIANAADELLEHIDKGFDAVNMASDQSFPASDPPNWRDGTE